MATTRDFYLARAQENAQEAAATTLENVRERCLRAEAAWLAMAARLTLGERLRDEAAKKRQEESAG